MIIFLDMAKLKRIAQIVNDIENFYLLSLMYSMNSNYSRRTLLKIITGGVFSIAALLFSRNRNSRKLKKKLVCWKKKLFPS